MTKSHWQRKTALAIAHVCTAGGSIYALTGGNWVAAIVFTMIQLSVIVCAIAYPKHWGTKAAEVALIGFIPLTFAAFLESQGVETMTANRLAIAVLFGMILLWSWED